MLYKLRVTALGYEEKLKKFKYQLVRCFVDLM